MPRPRPLPLSIVISPPAYTQLFLVSEAPKVKVVKKYESKTELDEYKTDEQKKEEVGVISIFFYLGYELPIYKPTGYKLPVYKPTFISPLKTPL